MKKKSKINITEHFKNTYLYTKFWNLPMQFFMGGKWLEISSPPPLRIDNCKRCPALNSDLDSWSPARITHTRSELGCQAQKRFWLKGGGGEIFGMAEISSNEKSIQKT